MNHIYSDTNVNFSYGNGYSVVADLEWKILVGENIISIFPLSKFVLHSSYLFFVKFLGSWEHVIYYVS